MKSWLSISTGNVGKLYTCVLLIVGLLGIKSVQANTCGPFYESAFKASRITATKMSVWEKIKFGKKLNSIDQRIAFLKSRPLDFKDTAWANDFLGQISKDIQTVGVNAFDRLDSLIDAVLDRRDLSSVKGTYMARNPIYFLIGSFDSHPKIQAHVLEVFYEKFLSAPNRLTQDQIASFFYQYGKNHVTSVFDHALSVIKNAKSSDDAVKKSLLLFRHLARGDWNRVQEGTHAGYEGIEHNNSRDYAAAFSAMGDPAQVVKLSSEQKQQLEDALADRHWVTEDAQLEVSMIRYLLGPSRLSAQEQSLIINKERELNQGRLIREIENYELGHLDLWHTSYMLRTYPGFKLQYDQNSIIYYRNLSID